jgi:hypothetical protein
MKPSTPPVRLGAYIGALVLLFVGAFGLGAVVDPLKSKPKKSHAGSEMPTPSPTDGHDSGHTDGHGDSHDDHGDAGHDAHSAPSGLAISQDGYTFVPVDATLPAGKSVPFRFTITGHDGHPVTKFDEVHEKELHLIVVRRDMSGFQHVHPERDASGVWSVELDLSSGGTYRAFADFSPEGHGSITLGTDITVGGTFAPVPLPEVSKTTTVDGYTVALEGAPVAGEDSEMSFTFTKNGKPVDDLETYLGAFGHLVSLRSGDLAYLHVHPAEEAEAGQHGGPTIGFSVSFPTAGTYRLYLDFQTEGKVRTAEFTITVGSAHA